MKIKKFISLLASMAMMVTAVTGAITVSAETDSGDCGEVKWSFDSSTGKLTISGNGAMASPDVDKATPTGDFANIYSYRQYEESIKVVVIEEGVTSIGFCAFYKMPNLETVILPSTITEFFGISTGRYIKCYSFAECKSLKNLTLTEGMTNIGGSAFLGCTSLESVTIPSTISIWGEKSFCQCSSLKNITLPEGLTSIGFGAFSETGIERIVIPSTINNWKNEDNPNMPATHNSAFSDCQNLSSVTFTEGLKSIGGYIFSNCPLLKRVAIPSSIENLTNAFNECTGLEEAYIEDGAQIMPYNNGNDSYFQNAFYNCTNLKKLEIPEGIGVTWLNPQWCTGCSALTDLYIHSQNCRDFPVGNNTSNIYCYYGSKTYSSLASSGSISIFRLKDIEEAASDAHKELDKAVAEAQAYDLDKYTPESYGVLKTALENAEKFDEKSTFVLPIEWAADDIMAAIEGLEEKKDEPPSSDPSDSSSNPSDSSNPSGSDQSQPSNSGSSQPTSAQPVTNAPTTATPKPVTPPTVTTAAKPAKVKNVKVTAKKKKLNVSWKKVSGATGYEVLSATNNKFTKNKKTVTVKKNKVTLKNLKPKKKYFVKVRAYKLANGRKYFGKWSKVVKKKTK